MRPRPSITNVYQVVAVNRTGVIHMAPVFADRTQAQRNAAQLAATQKGDLFHVITLTVEWPRALPN